MSNNIGNHLRKARTESGRSVKDVTSFLKTNGVDISEKTVYGWENGHSQPSPDCLLLLCRYYGIEDVLGYFGYKESSLDGGPTSEEKLANMLYESLQSSGYLKPGEYLTPKQFECLDGLSAMLSAFFDRR